MSNRWHEAYVELTDFIAEHPEVEIGVSVSSIPENVRPEFYRLFDTARTAFVEEKFPDLLNKGRLLSESYLKAEDEVIKLLGLESISISPYLHRFLHDPIDELRRGLFNPLFDLLKGKVDVERFEQEVLGTIIVTFGRLYPSGYEKWVVLSLVKLLQANKLFRVITRDVSPEEEARTERGSLPKEEVPPPEESKRLSFEHGLYPIFTVPDFIVHSARTVRYIAMRSEYSQAILRASNANNGGEWYPLNSVVALEPGLTLIYVADKPEEISLVADASSLCRPDFIIECRGQKDWYEKEGLKKVKLHHYSLKPKLGTYIISRNQMPQQAYRELMPEQVSGESAPEAGLIEPTLEQVFKESVPEQEQKPSHKLEPGKKENKIYIITTGFDQSKLEPIINKLFNPEGKVR